MKTIAIAIGWAAAMILLPLLARTGLVEAAALKDLGLVVPVLAVLHISALGRGRIRCQRGAS